MGTWKNTIIAVFALQILCANIASAETGKSRVYNAKTVSADISLSSLIFSLLLPINTQHNSNDWSLVDQYPIKWDKKDIAPSKKEKGQFIRRGLAMFTLGISTQASKWLIELHGKQSSLTAIRILSEDSFQDYSDISAYLRADQITLTVYKCSKETESYDGNVIYSINKPGKQSAWLKEGWYCNPTGKKAGWCSIELELIYFKEDADKIQCKAKS